MGTTPDYYFTGFLGYQLKGEEWTLRVLLAG